MASTTTTTTTTTTETADIDALLTTYLELLHTYTTLRSKLTALQSSTSLSLARANFSTPHQMGYTSGSNSKLRASVRLHVIPPDDDEANGSEEEGEGEEVFTLHAIDPEPASKKEGDDTGDEDEEGGADDEEGGDGEAGTDPNTEAPSTVKVPPPLPPIFGVLAPPSLREAQASAIQAVDTIAQLAGVEVRMRGVEVEVRRARKRALKAQQGSSSTR